MKNNAAMSVRHSRGKAFFPHFLPAFKTRADPSIHPITCLRRKGEELYGHLLREDINPSVPGSHVLRFWWAAWRGAFLRDTSQVPWEGNASPQFEKLELSFLTA